MIKHIVLLRFAEDTPAHRMEEISGAFCALKENIPHILDLEWGRNSSHEGLSKDLTHGFVLTFADEAGRDAYLIDPIHQSFVGNLRPCLRDVVVFDYSI